MPTYVDRRTPVKSLPSIEIGKNLHTTIMLITCILDTVRNAARLAVYVAIITLQKNQNPASRILLDKALGASPSPVKIQIVSVLVLVA